MSTSRLPQRLEPGEVASWAEQPGRRVIWFHSPCDSPGGFVMEGWYGLSAKLRESVPLRVVLFDDIPGAIRHEFGVRWNLRHQSEFTVWDSGQLLWRGVPFAGPGRDWEAWLEKWDLI